ncbi:MAG: helical backbone metal receptor [Oscillospiraceae bacterium]|nr:helical backbone metal receptor [Oscillospiraceae bacterium]
MKKIYIYFLAAALMFFSACSQVNESIYEPVETTAEEEILPYPVTIGSLVFNSSPESVVSLSPAITEIIAELGFSDRISGRSIYCDYPESISDAAEMGSAANPDVDAVIEAAPQLLISHSPIAKKDITAIESAGTRVLIISAPSSVEELYELYSSIYRVFNGFDGGEEDAVAEIFSPLEDAFEENSELFESYVYIISGELAVASDSTFAGDFLSHFGTNSAADESENAVSEERLLELDPEYIILSSQVSESSLPDGLTAVAEGKVIKLDSETEALLERPTSRVYLAVEAISGLKNSIDSEQSED